MRNLAVAAAFAACLLAPGAGLATPHTVASKPKQDAKADPIDSKPAVVSKSKTIAAPEQKPVVLISDAQSKVSMVYEHALPNVPGKSIKGILVEYKPGGSTPCHTHAKSAFIYATVLEGEITSQVNDGPIVTYKAGQNFSENPGDRHGVSRNPSKTKPAKLLAVFVVDTNDKDLTTPCKD